MISNKEYEKQGETMKISCGTDIIEVERIQKAIENLGDKFLKEVYTKKEIEYCISKNVMKYQHFTARFAAKEAVFKALSKFLENKYDLKWKDIEILNDNNGRPYVVLNKDIIKENIEIDISLSHIKDYAIANCVILLN